MQLDNVTLTVLERKLDGIALEMGVVMRRTARSPIFSESHDFSCFITDATGRLITAAEGIPIHTGGGGFAVEKLLEYWGDEIHPGDIFMSNDPYVAGGNHLPDWTVMCPVFNEGALTAFACNRAHQIDIGGGMAGTYNSNAVEIFDEGIRLPPMKIYASGVLRRDVWDMIALNTRAPVTVQGDVGAMIGSTRIGAGRLQGIFKEHGNAATVTAYFDGLLDYAERRMRAELERFPDGSWVGIEEMNNDVFTRRPVKIVATVTVNGSDVIVDFTGTDPTLKCFKNSSFANTHAAVYMAIACLMDSSMPKNHGTFRPIRIIMPRGTVVNPEPPAPCTYATLFPSMQIIHACWKAFAQAVPDRVSAGWGAPSVPSTTSYKDGEINVLYHWGGSSGAGAIKGRDGFDQLGSLVTLGGLILPNMELYEQLYPVHFAQWEFCQDGGGAGEFRGGTGVSYKVEVTERARWAFRGEAFYTPTGFGANGGLAGQAASATLDPDTASQREVPQYAIEELGSVTYHLKSAGGGGWGNPLRRDSQAVRHDVLNELVSYDAAHELYGVVLDPITLEIDAGATHERRCGRAEPEAITDAKQSAQRNDTGS